MASRRNKSSSSKNRRRRKKKKASTAAKKWKSLRTTEDSDLAGNSNVNRKLVWRDDTEEGSAQVDDLEFRRRMEEKLKAETENWSKIAKIMSAKGKAWREADMDTLDTMSYVGPTKFRSALIEGRVKPIDVFINYIKDLNDYDEEPHSVLKDLRLTHSETTKLCEDVQLQLDSGGGGGTQTQTDVEFWEAFLVVCKWEEYRRRRRAALVRKDALGVPYPPDLLADKIAFHPSLEGELGNFLDEKSHEDLLAIECYIESKLSSGKVKALHSSPEGERVVSKVLEDLLDYVAFVEPLLVYGTEDAAFWEVLLKWVRLYKAKLRLKDIHAKKPKKPKRPLHLIEETEESFCSRHIKSPIDHKASYEVQVKQLFAHLEREKNEKLSCSSEAP